MNFGFSNVLGHTLCFGLNLCILSVRAVALHMEQIFNLMNNFLLTTV